MRLFPYQNIQVAPAPLQELDEKVQEIYRTIIFNRDHTADRLLEIFINQSNSLTDLLSIKNAQMEAQSEEEAAQYLETLRYSVDFVLTQLRDNRDFTELADLFRLFRIISPETHARHPNRFRHRLVQVGSYVCPEPPMISSLMETLFLTIPHISHIVIRAIYFHHEAIRIHPFIDANGRTVRIAKNWMLMHGLYPPIFIRDEQEKQQYISTLSASFSALGNNPTDWNENLSAFFDQEISRLKDGTEQILKLFG
ncbi:MAG: Fic family protein [Candidatus Marinimicrobia bacterium]|nr:Fic family protein [Candidatus Neomarinimicrobiota bacterium]MCF7904087.1 Fic family protein [Candidatus Neomarinimicrobiota bacterium]